MPTPEEAAATSGSPGVGIVRSLLEMVSIADLPLAPLQTLNRRQAALTHATTWTVDDLVA